MGGDYYDRAVIMAPKDSKVSYGNDVVGKEKKLHKTLNPWTYIRGKGRIVSNGPNPIVLALDVTGSMGQWTKIIYDKFPMFYGQIRTHNYLPDPEVSFCAIGDVNADDSPLQVTRFGRGRQIDELIVRMWLEGGGGGNQKQSYEMAAYFYNRHTNMNSAELAFFFVTGDEGYFEYPKSIQFSKYLGDQPKGEYINGKSQWNKLMQKFNVFHIKKEYDNKLRDVPILQQWVDTLGAQRVLKISDPKACVDIILGAICLTSGTRTLETYVRDMEERLQSKQRIDEVVSSLRLYSQALIKKKIIPVRCHPVKGYKNQFENEQPLSPPKLRPSKSSTQSQKQTMPQNLHCPITGQLFSNPVIAADGHTYENSAITEWLKTHDTSPMTGIRLPNKTLMPNFLIKKLISEMQESMMRSAKY